jgi:hypothetical protein
MIEKKGNKTSICGTILSNKKKEIWDKLKNTLDFE